jgi:deoxyribonuclease-4
VVVGAHVRGGGALADVVDRGVALGAEAVQIFTQSPRSWRPARHDAAAVAGFRERWASQQDAVQAVFCHASYLVNLATSDPELLARSEAALAANLQLATAMGADGLVLHVGSHRGSGLAGCMDQIVAALARALESAGDPPGGRGPCPILLENAAGAGGTVGRDFGELASILAALDAGDRVGVCLDTQHLWASGVDFGGPEEAEAVLDELEERIGLARLRCVHLNDSAVPRGANRDRHANLGQGSIGEERLAWLVGHPALARVPAVLEVPGEGQGPTAEQVALAKAVVREGQARWAARRPATRGRGGIEAKGGAA